MDYIRPLCYDGTMAEGPSYTEHENVARLAGETLWPVP